MRIHEIIFESNVSNEIINDLMDLVTTYLHANIEIIPMNGPGGVVEYLRNLGHTLDVNSLIEIALEPPLNNVVSRANNEEIVVKLNTVDTNISKDEEEKSKEKVDKAATKVAKNVVKTKDSI